MPPVISRAAATVAICAACIAGPATARATTVTHAVSGTVTVPRGQQLVVVHKISGGVGLSWTLERHTNRAALALVRVTSVPDNPDPSAVGGYSTTRWTFRARRAGRATLVYVRDFRGDDKRYVLHVRVV